MKKLTKISFYILLCVGFVLTSCSEEELPLEDNGEVVAVDSQLTNLMVRTSSENNAPDSIDCIDFVYPISFFIYDANNQQTGTQTVNSDVELFLFLSGLTPGSTVAIDFPISVILQDGSIVEVNSNTELATLISNCASGGGNQVPSNLEDILTTGSWFVTYFFDDVEETSNYAGYEFNFNTDNTALANNGTNNVNGTWSLTGSSTPDLNLFFGTTNPFDELDEDWDIIEATNDIIRLKHISGGNGDVDFLTYERTPNTGGGGGGGTGGGSGTLVETLVDGVWYVNLLEDDGNNETCHFQAYEFTFNANQTVIAVSPNNTKNGSWAVTNSSSGQDLVLNFQTTGSNDPFDDLNDDWDLISFDAQSISLIDISGGNGGTDYLTFGRNPYTGCTGGGGGTQGLVDVLSDGQWFVQSYIDDGDDETYHYTSYTIVFNIDGTVVATNSNGTINGTWNVTNSSSGLDLVLNFGGQIPFDEFNDDWDVSNYTTTLVELFDVSGGNGGTDYLTFAKL